MDKTLQTSLEALQAALRASTLQPVPDGFKSTAQWAQEWAVDPRRARENLSKALSAGLAVKEKYNGKDHYKLIIKKPSK